MKDAEKGVLDVIYRRRSIRVFAAGSVGDEEVKSLLEAAMAAPSAAAKDPWRFVVVRDQHTLRRVAGVLPNGTMIAEAALGIVVCGDLEAAHDRQVSYLLQDCAAAIENLLLAASMMGLGACWLGVHPREERVRKVADMFGLLPPVIPVAVIAVGRPGETKEARTRYNPAFVHQERW